MNIQRWVESSPAAAGEGGGDDEEDTPEKIAEMAKKASNRGTVDIAPESTDDDEEEDARISPIRSPDRPHDAPADNTRHRLGSNIFKHVIIRIGHIIYSCNPVCHLYIYIYIYIDIDRYIYIYTYLTPETAGLRQK